MTAVRTTAVRETAEPCSYYPCDSAYSRSRHPIDAEGRVRHLCRSNSDAHAGWSTGMVSFEFPDDALPPGMWQPYLEITDDEHRHMYLLGKADEVERLAFGLLTSSRRSLEVAAFGEVTP